MFNPLVTNLSELTDPQIEEKITDLSQKYWQTKNLELQNQIAVILHMYKEELSMRRAKAMKKLRQDDENGLDSLINIS